VIQGKGKPGAWTKSAPGKTLAARWGGEIQLTGGHGLRKAVA
jgi:hypothetical protein